MCRRQVDRLSALFVGSPKPGFPTRMCVKSKNIGIAETQALTRFGSPAGRHPSAPNVAPPVALAVLPPSRRIQRVFNAARISGNVRLLARSLRITGQAGKVRGVAQVRQRRPGLAASRRAHVGRELVMKRSLAIALALFALTGGIAPWTGASAQWPPPGTVGGPPAGPPAAQDSLQALCGKFPNPERGGEEKGRPRAGRHDCQGRAQQGLRADDLFRRQRSAMSSNSSKTIRPGAACPTTPSRCRKPITRNRSNSAMPPATPMPAARRRRRRH